MHTLPEQHSALLPHVAPCPAQQVPDAGQVSPTQHVEPPMHEAPAAAHGGGPQWPAVQTSPEQHSPSAAQLAPVPLQHLPAAHATPPQQSAELPHELPVPTQQVPPKHEPLQHCAPLVHDEPPVWQPATHAPDTHDRSVQHTSDVAHA